MTENIEIERRWLLLSPMEENEDIKVISFEEIIQHYLYNELGSERIRQSRNLLTGEIVHSHCVKTTRDDGPGSLEATAVLDIVEYQEFLCQSLMDREKYPAAGAPIYKTRTTFKHNDIVYELDDITNIKSNILEVEFADEDSANEFDKLELFTNLVEITGIQELSNGSIYRDPATALAVIRSFTEDT